MVRPGQEKPCSLVRSLRVVAQMGKESVGPGCSLGHVYLAHMFSLLHAQGGGLFVKVGR